MKTAPITFQDFTRAAPEVYAGLAAVGKAIDAAGVDKALSELLKLRVSQLNGCAFCLQFHLDVARRIGVDGRKIDLLAGWRDAGVFSEREQAALAWAEALTGLGDHVGYAAAQAQVRAHFEGGEFVHLTAAIASINAWNRIAVGLHIAP
ncbi:MAG: carboxymuconolactone decarboxylase family protein [Pseudomonas monteilii]|nr:MAG: carboxymuconolactone decarboxylase family protein [Pseudomonas monteilii]